MIENKFIFLLKNFKEIFHITNTFEFRFTYLPNVCPYYYL